MDETQAAEAVVAWAGELLKIPEERRYSWPIDLKGEMPDVVAVVLRSRFAQSDSAFPFAQLQQAWLFVCEIEVSVMVDKADTDDDSEDVQRALEGYGKALREGAITDASLGGRVQMTSPLIEVEYPPPPPPDEGGIKARGMLMILRVAELHDAP
jgi:hypothetical protein